MAKTAVEIDELHTYDHIAVAFSGGKDSAACYFHLLEKGVPAEKIELWHHDVDGQGHQFMDWPCTADFCRKFAAAYDGSRILFSWREGGFLGEMLRDDTPTGRTLFETVDGETMAVGGKGPGGTRRKFPQVTANLNQRWCSAYLKIDVSRRVYANDPRFKAGKFLILTGERAEESSARAKYLPAELHPAATKKRVIHQWRPVHAWDEKDVWEIMRRWGSVPHPCYRLGFGRCSCSSCIFGNDDQWASIKALNPAQFERIAGYEEEFGLTIHRTKSIRERADKGSPYPAIAQNPELAAASQEETYTDVVRTASEDWVLPAGAFTESSGPT
jgi:3'-phosphoadenosine 5'-phosphosulfate sulfotransferase (PAPS reductase)/FAD synthetase